MFRTITASYAGKCKRCGQDFPAGTRIRYGGRGRTYHLGDACPARQSQSSRATGEDAYLDEQYDGAFYHDDER